MTGKEFTFVSLEIAVSGRRSSPRTGDRSKLAQWLPSMLGFRWPGLAELSKGNAEPEPMDANEQSEYWGEQPVPADLAAGFALVSFSADFAERLEHAKALLQEASRRALLGENRPGNGDLEEEHGIGE
jgi:hypothetical protein